MIEHSEHPEGIQVAIELLQSLPPDMLHEFLVRTYLCSDEKEFDIWNELVEDWYGNRLVVKK